MGEGLRERAEAFLVQCGACDAGLPMGCACHDADPRPVIAALLDRLEAAEAAVERVRALADEWASWTTMWQGVAAAELREALEGRESHVEAPGSADRGAGGVDGRSEGCEGRSGGMG